MKSVATILQARPETPLIQAGKTTTVHIELLNNRSAGIDSIDVDLQYDATLLSAVSCSIDSSNLCNAGEPGVVEIAWTSTPALTDDKMIASIVFVARDTVTGTTSLVLHKDEPNAPFDVVHGVLSIGDRITDVQGDVNCDYSSTASDARDILRYSVKLLGALDHCPVRSNTINVTVCNVNGDLGNTCNAIDALYVLQCSVGIQNSFCPTALQSVAAANSENVTTFEPPAIYWGQPYLTDNLTVTIPLLGNLTAAVGAGEIQVFYTLTTHYLNVCTKGSTAIGEFSCNPHYTERSLRLSFIADKGITGTQEIALLHFRPTGDLQQALETLSPTLQIQVETLASTSGNSLLQPALPNSTLFLPIVSR